MRQFRRRAECAADSCGVGDLQQNRCTLSIIKFSGEAGHDARSEVPCRFESELPAVAMHFDPIPFRVRPLRQNLRGS